MTTTMGECHGITKTDAYGYFQTPAWHKLGNDFGGEMSAAAGFKKIGALWQMKKVEISATMPDGRVVRLDNWRAHVREDTGEAFAVVSKDYASVQNDELCELADLLRKVDPTAHLDSGGTLHGGRRVYLLMKLREWKVAGGDSVMTYLCVFNDHAAKGAVKAFFTTIRVVCRNTLRLALWAKRGAFEFRARHRGAMRDKLDDAKVALGFATEADVKAQEMFRRLASVTVSDTSTRTFFEQVYSRTYGTGPKAARVTRLTEQQAQQVGAAVLEEAFDKASPSKVLDEAMERFQEQRSARLFRWTENYHEDVARGTAWGALNAVTQYHDHQAVERQSDARRANAALFGVSDKRKAIALEQVLDWAMVPSAR